MIIPMITNASRAALSVESKGIFLPVRTAKTSNAARIPKTITARFDPPVVKEFAFIGCLLL
jgi:hypothetical protein